MSPENRTERSLDAITVGVRHRQDLGDIDELANSINEIGMLQPITITPDGVLICGRRRLEAVRRLGWRTVKVWIRSGISDRLTELLAQQDENSLHKPLSPIEQADLYTELKELYAEEARRRQEASRFGGDDIGQGDGVVPGHATSAGANGSGDSPEPSPNTLESRYQAAKTVTGKGSYQRLDHIKFLQAVARDPFQPSTVRELAAAEIATVADGGPVEPAYRKVQAAIELAAQPTPETDDIARLSADAFDRVKQSKARRGLHLPGPAAEVTPEEAPPKYRTLRAFLLTWSELAGWSRNYDVAQLAKELNEEEWALFKSVVDETVTLRDRVAVARDQHNPAPSTATP